ncbi:Cloroperoxidase [Punctularia strigosozonata HHB-11173 SS5]|uniref:Cloroperoxidase n=1 Tax=Punctularia strigosozonata (strain HHB-11173) TaxID=741275 RepID=UPI00044179A1|nr:Cloroperoxidase [Punctularia strigosozonata HHB-11173 SS5]EIN08073.1 Cloroperoxidase [Punctularia strigosozonata HHB-11173 SS5]
MLGIAKNRYTFISSIIAAATWPFHAISLVLGLERLPFDAEHHPFVAPSRKDGDVRSPCPALNTMANHGYLPHNGKDIGPVQLISGLMRCFGLSFFLATFLTCGSMLLIGQWRFLSLYDYCRHNGVEHAASLAHPDVRRHDPQRGYDEYAPSDMSKDLWKKLLQDSADGHVLTVDDIARARVRRERDTTVPLDRVHAHIARGEIGLVLDIFGGPKREIPIPVLEQWWKTEQFPPGWKPTRKQGFVRTGVTGELVKFGMDSINGIYHPVIDPFLRIARIFRLI